MVSTTCWHCQTFAQMVRPEEEPNGTYSRDPIIRLPEFPDIRFVAEYSVEFRQHKLVIFSCTACGYPNIAQLEIFDRLHDEDEFDAPIPMSGQLAYHDPSEQIERWLPVQPMGKRYPDAPKEIGSIACEAHKCFQIGAYRAAVALSRATLEGIVGEQENPNPSSKQLYQRIQDLVKSGKIKSRTAEAAAAIRLSGNISVHYPEEKIDHDFAEIVIGILDSVIDDLYSNPTLVDRARKYAQNAKSDKRKTEQ